MVYEQSVPCSKEQLVWFIIIIITVFGHIKRSCLALMVFDSFLAHGAALHTAKCCGRGCF